MDYDVPASQLVPVLDTVLDAAHHRLAESGAAARTVTVRLRNAQFTTIGRSVSLPQACTELGELRSAALAALRAATEAMGLDTEEESGAGARLLGVALGALSTSTQLTLLPGETAHQTPTDPAALPLPPQDNQPTALGHRAVQRTAKDSANDPRGPVVRCVRSSFGAMLTTPARAPPPSPTSIKPVTLWGDSGLSDRGHRGRSSVVSALTGTHCAIPSRPRRLAAVGYEGAKPEPSPRC